MIKISLRFVPKVPIDNKSALVQILAYRLTGDESLSEPTMAYFWCIDASHGLNEFTKGSLVPYVSVCLTYS